MQLIFFLLQFLQYPLREIDSKQTIIRKIIFKNEDNSFSYFLELEHKVKWIGLNF